MSELSPLPSEVLPAGIRARFVSGINGLRMHVERMQNTACTHLVGYHFLDGAGHWVQQEQAARVSELLLDFVKGHAA